jgi:iron complex transport system ATP-binding protein
MAGLDMTAGFDFQARLRKLARQGRNLLLVTHHLNEIPPEVGRVIVLRDGAVAADGPKASVLTSRCISDVYGVPVNVTEIEGYFMVYPDSPSRSSRSKAISD